MTTLAELVQDVAARHEESQGPWPDDGHVCLTCWQKWPCDAARLAALLTPESVAAGLDAVLDRRGPLLLSEMAAALLAAITEVDGDVYIHPAVEDVRVLPGVALSETAIRHIHRPGGNDDDR